MRQTTMHRFFKLAWALVLMLVLSFCTTVGSGYRTETCARLVIVNHAWSDIKVYSHEGRLGGAVPTNGRRVHALCSRQAAVLRVQALGGDFDFLISAEDQTWIPGRSYTLTVENAVHLSTLYPFER